MSSDSTPEHEIEIISTGDETLNYKLKVEQGGMIDPVDATVGSRTGDELVDPRTFHGGIGPDDRFDRLRFTGEIESFEPINRDDIEVYIDGEAVDPAKWTEQRFYVFGNDWKGDDDSQEEYVISVDGHIEKDAKADEFDSVERYNGGELVTGHVPMNSDDAFKLWGSVRWVFGNKSKLNWMLNREHWEPPWRGKDPRDENPTPDASQWWLGTRPAENGSEHYPDLDTAGADGPDPELNDEYEHYAEVNSTGPEVRYAILTTGEIRAASSGDRTDNRGAFGVGRGRAKGWRDGYYYNGSIWNVFAGPWSVGEYRRQQGDASLGVMDLPYAILVDGEAIDHDCYDPRTDWHDDPLDLAIGYEPGGLPDEIQPTGNSADHIIRSAEGWDNLSDSMLSPGEHVRFDGEIDVGQIAGAEKELFTDATTISTAPGARLVSSKAPDGRWGNIFLKLGGKHSAVLDFRAQGAGAKPEPYDSTAAMGILPVGEYQTVANAHLSQFGQFNLQDRGMGLTVYCVDSVNSMTDGSGYGISSNGPADVDGWDEQDYNLRQPYQERTSAKFFRVDGCRHGVERGNNGASETRAYVIGPNTVHGGASDDAHRFWQGEDVRSRRIEPKGTPATISEWGRGRPRLARWSEIWHLGWDATKWAEQSDPATASRNPDMADLSPFAQRCATDPYYRDRDKGWDKSDGPLLAHPGEIVQSGEETVEPDGLAWQFDAETTVIGGEKPAYISPELMDAYEALQQW